MPESQHTGKKSPLMRLIYTHNFDNGAEIERRRAGSKKDRDIALFSDEIPNRTSKITLWSDDVEGLRGHQSKREARTLTSLLTSLVQESASSLVDRCIYRALTNSTSNTKAAFAGIELLP